MRRLLLLLLLLAFIPTAFATESSILVTYGSDARTSEGDNDFIQVLFFSIPATFTDSVYIRVFDADVGGNRDAQYGEWNTQARYRLYGGTGAFTGNGVRNPLPENHQLTVGTLLADTTIGEDPFHDNNWYTFARMVPNQGELVDGNYIFRMLVEGVSGNDGNIYEVAVSRRARRNAPIDNHKVFNYCPTIRLPNVGVQAELRFFVPEGVQEIRVHNFDLASAIINVHTRFREGIAVSPSEQGQWAEDVATVETWETGQDIALVFAGGYEMPNDATFYITDQTGTALAIEWPILIMRPNARPVPRFELNPLSDCGNIVFDASRSSDEDGDALSYHWSFGDGQEGTGSRVVHRYLTAGEFEAELIVSDNSGRVGNSSRRTVNVLVNEPPMAEAGPDQVVIPGQQLTFDGSGSIDNDGSISRYIWDFGDETRAEGMTVTHTYNQPDNYVVTLRVEDDSNSPCNFDTDELDVLVNAPPNVDIGENLIISPNEVVQLSGARSYDSDGEIVHYEWDFGDNTTGRGIAVSHSYDTPGRYRVRLTIYDDTDVDNNSANDAIYITVNDPPDAIAHCNDDLVATEQVITFNAYSSVDRDGELEYYAWTFGDGARAEGQRVQHSYDRSGDYRVVLTVRDNSTTSSDTDTDTIDIHVNHPPVADAGTDQWVTTSEVRFNANLSSDVDGQITRYSWDFGDGATGSGVSPVHVYGNPGTYNVELVVTDDSETETESTSDRMIVVINSSPIADAGPDIIGAPGETITFNGARSIDPDGSISAFNWSFGDGTRGSGESTTHVYTRPGTYAATLTVQDNTNHSQAVSHDAVRVFINESPVAVAGNDVLASPGTRITFSGTESYDNDGDISTYQWDFSDGLETASTSRKTRVFENPGIYTATLTVVDNSGAMNAQAQDQVVIRINHEPIANPGEDIHTCDPTIVLSGGGSVDADGDPLTYHWDFGDGSPSRSGVRVIHTYDTPGIYPVILTVDDGTALDNSTHSSSIMVTINQAPVANAGTDRTVCAGDVVLFSGAGSYDPEGGLLRYRWDFGEGTTDVGVNPTKTYDRGGVYRVTLTVEDDSGLPCNTDIDQIIVRVAESPVAVAGDDKIVCANAEVDFDGTQSRDFDGLVNRYFWDFGDGTSQDGPTPTHVFREAGEYIVTLTITGDRVGECDNSDSDELIVTVIDAPIATFTSISAAPVGERIEFDAAESDGGGGDITEYDWNFGDGESGEGETIAHAFDSAGVYFVTLYITTDAETECNTTFTRNLITINEAPVANAGNDQLVGVNQVIVLDGSQSYDNDGSIALYEWDFGDGNTGTGIQTRHMFSEPGRYDIRLHVEDDTELANNSAEDHLIITVNAPPEPEIFAPENVCANQEIRFSGAASSDPDGQIVSYHWEFGDGTSGDGGDVTHSYFAPGLYNVTLSVDDGRNVSNSSVETTVAVAVNHPPVAVAGSDRLICPGVDEFFDGTDSYDRDGIITTYNWNFGDGSRMVGSQVYHTFERPGTYVVTLNVTDNSGTECSITNDQVTVRVNAPPVANAGGDKEAYVGGAHDGITFDGTDSNDPDQDPLTYSWDFGDGGSAEGPVVTYAYRRPGTYTVRLTVHDGTGLPCGEDVDEITVTVNRRDVSSR